MYGKGCAGESKWDVLVKYMVRQRAVRSTYFGSEYCRFPFSIKISFSLDSYRSSCSQFKKYRGDGIGKSLLLAGLHFSLLSNLG